MIRTALLAACALACVAPAAPAHSAPVVEDVTKPVARDSLQTDIADVQVHYADIRRVLQVGYRVSRALSASCPGTYSYGFAIDHPAMYRADLAAALGLAPGSPYPRVIAVAAGSPEEAAGLQVGDVLLAAASTSLAVTGRGFAPVEPLIDRIEAAGAGGRLTLDVFRNGTPLSLTFALAPGCGGWFDVKPASSPDAVSNLRWVQPTDALLHDLPRDDDLAFVLGHETGHRILRLRARAAQRKVTRQDCLGDCEIYADSVGVAAMPCVGADPARSLDVLKRLRLRRDAIGSFLGLYAERTQAMQAAVARSDRTCPATPL